MIIIYQYGFPDFNGYVVVMLQKVLVRKKIPTVKGEMGCQVELLPNGSVKKKLKKKSYLCCNFSVSLKFSKYKHTKSLMSSLCTKPIKKESPGRRPRVP